MASVQATIILQQLTDEQMSKFYEQKSQRKLDFILPNIPMPAGQRIVNAIEIHSVSADNLLTIAQIIKSILESAPQASAS